MDAHTGFKRLPLKLRKMVTGEGLCTGTKSKGRMIEQSRLLEQRDGLQRDGFLKGQDHF